MKRRRPGASTARGFAEGLLRGVLSRRCPTYSSISGGASLKLCRHDIVSTHTSYGGSLLRRADALTMRPPLLAVLLLAAPLYLLARASLVHREWDSGARRAQGDYTPLQPHPEKARLVQLDFYGEALCPGPPLSRFYCAILDSRGMQQHIFLCMYGRMGMAPCSLPIFRVIIPGNTRLRLIDTLCTQCLLSDTRACAQIAHSSRQRYWRRCSSRG